MGEIEHDSLRYFMARACAPQWREFLAALGDELAEQLPLDELRGLFYALGKRMAAAAPLPAAASLDELEGQMNVWFGARDLGWTQVRDLQHSVEFWHVCAPLRGAFGERAMPATGALLEGLYATWLSTLGAGGELALRQIAGAEGPCDVLRFRLAHASVFA